MGAAQREDLDATKSVDFSPIFVDSTNELTLFFNQQNKVKLPKKNVFFYP